MEQFKGFPAKMQFTPMPNLFFSRLLPQINDMAELKTTLHILEMLYHKRGYPRFVTYVELLANKSLMSSLKQITKPADETLHGALEAATKRGTILHIVLDRDGKGDDIYFLNTEADRLTIDRIKSGELHIPGLKAMKQIYIEEEQPDIYTLYEQNIGPLTALIGEDLTEAGSTFPKAWIEEAFHEAVKLNKRNWKYIYAILKRWQEEGKDEVDRRDRETDPKRYTEGKYGHLIKH